MGVHRDQTHRIQGFRYPTAMSGFDFDGDDPSITASNVIWLRQREKARQSSMYEPARLEAERFPVDIRGDVTFGRLMSGLSTVGLTVRIDARSGRIVISDDVDA